MSKSQDERIASLTITEVYPLYLAKVEKKGRTADELNQVIAWLTGFDDAMLGKLINDNASFESFFAKANLNPAASTIKGVICGVRIENIENPLTQKIRMLDKLVDELAKGKAMIKILRTIE